MATEYIIAAAVIWDGKTFALPAPARHGDCINLLAKEYPHAFVQPEDQGFVTSHLRFVSRRVGKIIAREANQLNEDSKKRPTHPELFSEDLW